MPVRKPAEQLHPRFAGSHWLVLATDTRAMGCRIHATLVPTNKRLHFERTPRFCLRPATRGEAPAPAAWGRGPNKGCRWPNVGPDAQIIAPCSPSECRACSSGFVEHSDTRSYEVGMIAPYPLFKASFDCLRRIPPSACSRSSSAGVPLQYLLVVGRPDQSTPRTTLCPRQRRFAFRLLPNREASFESRRAWPPEAYTITRGIAYSEQTGRELGVRSKSKQRSISARAARRRWSRSTGC
jgi:hypothetical protein